MDKRVLVNLGSLAKKRFACPAAKGKVIFRRGEYADSKVRRVILTALLFVYRGESSLCALCVLCG